MLVYLVKYPAVFAVATLSLLLCMEAATFGSNNYQQQQQQQQEQQQQLLQGSTFVSNNNYQQQQQLQQQQQQQQQQQHQQQSQFASSFNAGANTGAITTSNTNTPQFINGISNDKNRKPIKGDPEKAYVDRFDHRYPDGSYEFRYELIDGTVRYERGYFLLYDKVKSLVVVGYYSYRMPDGRYITVFYNADHNGYRQNQSITPQFNNNLPRTIDVPEFKEDSLQQQNFVASTTPYPKFTTTPTRRGGY